MPSDDQDQGAGADDGWCEETGMPYAMMDILDDMLRMFLPWPFHESIDHDAPDRPGDPGGEDDDAW